jgi:hypothetical protein
VHKTMQLHKTMRMAGVSLSAAALALLTAEGPATAHERTASPDLRGRVTSVAAGDFVLHKYDGAMETVDTTDATIYSEPGNAVAPPGVYDGENVAVTLDPTAPIPTATNVVVFPEKLGGRVTNVAGSTVTLTTTRGSDTVIVSSNTKYYEKGTSPTGVSNGEAVSVLGLPDAGTPGALDAQVVAIFSPATTPQPQPQPTTAGVSGGASVGTPNVGPAVPQSPAHNAPGGNWSAPGGPAASHAPAGSSEPASATGGSLGGHGFGSSGGRGFNHR